MRYDTIIIGGGIIGASTAYALAKAGQNILLIEQFEPAHNKGSSHGDGRVIRFNYPEAIYVDMAKLAYQAWDDLSQAANQPMIHITGVAEMGEVGNPQMDEQVANFELTGINYELLDPASYMVRFPQVYVPPDSEVLLQPDGGAVFATSAVLALWKLIQELGGDTITNRRVTSIEANDAGVIVHADDQTWQANKLVVAAGSWVNKVLAPLDINIPLHVTQEQLAYFAPKDDIKHGLGDINILLDWHFDPPFYTIPQIDIGGMKAGWHHTGIEVDPDNRVSESDEIWQGISNFIGERFPHLQTTPLETVTCLYSNTPDFHFVLDTHPTLSNVVIGAGFSGHGFKFGPTLGDILAALVLEETPPLDLSTFSIKRFDNPDQLVRRTGA